MFTRTSFEDACKAYIAKHNSHWSWSDHPTYPGLGFLQQQLTVTSDNEEHTLDEAVLAEPEDVSVATSTSQVGERISVSAYVVYSPTFQLPTLYFSMHNSSGVPLSLDEIIATSFFRSRVLPKSESSSYALHPPSMPFPLLSQGEHPTLRIPCWYLHPCETGTALNELLEADRQVRAVDDEHLRLLELWFLMLNNIVDLQPPSIQDISEMR